MTLTAPSRKQIRAITRSGLAAALIQGHWGRDPDIPGLLVNRTHSFGPITVKFGSADFDDMWFAQDHEPELDPAYDEWGWKAKFIAVRIDTPIVLLPPLGIVMTRCGNPSVLVTAAQAAERTAQTNEVG